MTAPRAPAGPPLEIDDALAAQRAGRRLVFSAVLAVALASSSWFYDPHWVTTILAAAAGVHGMQEPMRLRRQLGQRHPVIAALASHYCGALALVSAGIRWFAL